jgi:hypothetical protein
MKEEDKAIGVIGSGGPQGCEALRFPHFLNTWLKDGGEVVSLMRQQATLYPKKYCWYSFPNVPFKEYTVPQTNEQLRIT